MDLNEVATILDFYQSRVQEGAGMNHFYTPYTMQKGSGIGSYLSGVFRPLIPIATKGSSYLKPHVKKMLSNISDDLHENPTLSNLKTSLKRRGIDGLESFAGEICSKMKGGELRKRKATTQKTSRSRKTIKRGIVKKKAPVKRKPSTRKKPIGIEYPLFK